MGIIGALLAAVVSFSSYQAEQTRIETDAILDNVSQRYVAVARWAGLTETNSVRTSALVLSDGPAVQSEFKDVIAATSAQISEVQKSLESLALSDREKAPMAKIGVATQKHS